MARIQVSRMTVALKAACAYAAIVFAIGFALGTLRVLFVAPGLGEAGAVLVELPVMLAVSWIACGRIVGRYRVPGRPGTRLMMGGVAFLLLMLAELGVSVFAFGRTVAEHFDTYASPVAALGLAAQIAFALFPLLHLRGRGSRS